MTTTTTTTTKMKGLASNGLTLFFLFWAGCFRQVLHSVHRDQRLHHLRHHHRRLLRSGDGHVRPLLARLARNGKAPKRSAQSAGRQEERQPPLQFQVRFLNCCCPVASLCPSAHVVFAAWEWISFISIRSSSWLDMMTSKETGLPLPPGPSVSIQCSPSGQQQQPRCCVVWLAMHK